MYELLSVILQSRQGRQKNVFRVLCPASNVCVHAHMCFTAELFGLLLHLKVGEFSSKNFVAGRVK